MTIFVKTAAAAIALFAITGNPVKPTPPDLASKPVIKNKSPRIQAAILLDVSNSMDGLIEQAKTQLWNMVSVMGRAKCEGQTPQIEIALYEYGSPRNDEKKGYVKQISPFTTDLDGLSDKLFSLTTNGGDEYCGQVIFTSIDELQWDTSRLNYKVIFIAGNEDFLQGNLHYTKACDAAKHKGVIVNTIYCGDRANGIREHWNLLGECGNGSYSNINQGIQEEYIATPYDSTIMALNDQLNGTYMAYGANGYAKVHQQTTIDSKSMTTSKASALKRAEVKSKPKLYKNSTWDVVDASIDDSNFVYKVDMNTLPDTLQTKSRAELKKIVDSKKQERTAIQSQITKYSDERSTFLIEERKKKAATNNQPTLQSETEKIIIQQAKRFNMVIE